jgi:hypothetical protein
MCTVLSGEDRLATYGTDLYTGSTAETPKLPIDSGTYLASGAVIGLISTGGTNPDYTQNTTITPAYLNPGLQVTVTADDAEVADRVIDKVFYSLCKIRNRTINGNWYRWVKPLQSQPIDMGIDKRGQAKRVLNFISSYNRRENL